MRTFPRNGLVECYNADLANSLGNLVNRTLNMMHRYRDGRIDYALKTPYSITRRIEKPLALLELDE